MITIAVFVSLISLVDSPELKVAISTCYEVLATLLKTTLDR